MFAFDAVRFTFRISGMLSPRMAGRMAARLFHTPPKVALTPDQLALARKADEILDRSDRQVMDIEGQKVVTWRMNAVGQSRGTVVLIHGWTGAARFMVGFATEVVAAGYDAVLMDLPAHGASTGRTTDVAECGRVLRAILHKVGPVRGLIGHSFAGGVISVALNDPETAALADEANIAIVSSPNQYSYVTRQFAGFVELTPPALQVFEDLACARIGMKMQDAQGHKLLADVDCPMLVVHCRDDVEISVNQALRWKAGRKSARLHLTRGYGHRNIVHAPEVTRLVADFIAEGPAAKAGKPPRSLFALFTEFLRRLRPAGPPRAT